MILPCGLLAANDLQPNILGKASYGLNRQRWDVIAWHGSAGPSHNVASRLGPGGLKASVVGGRTSAAKAAQFVRFIGTSETRAPPELTSR